MNSCWLSPSPNGTVCARQRREPVPQSTQVEQRPADEQRQPAARTDLADESGSVARESSCRVGLGRLQDVDEMMRDGAAYSRGRFRGADVEPAINERRVHADYFERYSFGQR